MKFWHRLNSVKIVYTLVLKGNNSLTYFLYWLLTPIFFCLLFLFWLNSFQLNRSKMHRLFSFQIVKTCCFLFLIFFLSQLLKASNLFCNLHFAKFLQTFLLLFLPCKENTYPFCEWEIKRWRTTALFSSHFL